MTILIAVCRLYNVGVSSTGVPKIVEASTTCRKVVSVLMADVVVDDRTCCGSKLFSCTNEVIEGCSCGQAKSGSITRCLGRLRYDDSKRVVRCPTRKRSMVAKFLNYDQ